MNNNINNNNKFDRRSYDSSTKKLFSNYMANRSNSTNTNNRSGYNNKYNNNNNHNDRFSGQQNNSKNNLITADLPDRNATTFDLSAAVMMGLQQHQEKNDDHSKEKPKSNPENVYLPRKQTNTNSNNYNSSKSYNHDNSKPQNMKNNYQQGYQSNQQLATSRFQNTCNQNENTRWNNNNSGNKSSPSLSMNRGSIVPGNLNSRYSGNMGNYNSNKTHQPRSRFQGGSTYVPNNNNNKNNSTNSGGNSSYYRPNSSRFESSNSSKYGLQNNYQRSEYKPNTYNNNNSYTGNMDLRPASPSVASENERYSQSNTTTSTADTHHSIKDVTKTQSSNKHVDKKRNSSVESIHKNEPSNEKSNISLINKQNDNLTNDDESIKLPLKKKQIIDDDEEEDLNVDEINASEIETDAMDTPLKPRQKALDDTIKTKIKTELKPTNLNEIKKETSNEGKKSLISEIEAEAKYFSSLQGNTSNKHPITQRQVSIKRDPYGKTKLHTAVNKNDLVTVKKLIEEQGYDPNLQDYAGMTALHSACAKGFYKIVEYLVSLPNINMDLVTEDNSETALFDACVKLEVDIVKLLLQHNSKISIENSENKNVLVYMKEALEDEDYEDEEDKEDLIKIIALLERYWPIVETTENNESKKHIHSTDHNRSKKYNNTSDNEHYSNTVTSHKRDDKNGSGDEESDNGDDEDELEFDILDIASKYGKDKFYKASCKGDYNYVGQFLQNGGRPDKESFIECCKRGHMDLISLFLALTTMNVNMKISHSNGKNLLMLCCGRGNFDVVKLLVDSGADFMHLDDDGNDVLYYVKRNKKAGWEKESEFLQKKIDSKGGILRKRKEVSVPISPKRVIKPKSSANTPNSPLARNNSKSKDLSKSPSTASSRNLDNAANSIKRKFYQLNEDDIVEPLTPVDVVTATVAPPKIKKQPIIKKIKLGGNDDSPSSSIPPASLNKTNSETSVVNMGATDSALPGSAVGGSITVSNVDKVAIAESIEPADSMATTPIEDMKQQKTREIFEQMEKYEQIKKEKEQALINKQLEEERLIEEEKQNAIKLKEQEFLSLSGNLLCMGLQSVTNDDKPISLPFLTNVGPIYYRLINDQIYVLNAQFYYIFNGNKILSSINNTIPITNKDYELNKIWSFYKDLFLLGYKNDSKLMEFYETEILSVDSLDYKLQFETYQKSLLDNIELTWVPLNDILAKIVDDSQYKHVISYLLNNMIEIYYEKKTNKDIINKSDGEMKKEDKVNKQGIYYNDLPAKLKYRPIMKEIINNKPLW
ncbi:hypothetical protein ACO0SA_001459 [Hanseniaspora valbyensis]